MGLTPNVFEDQLVSNAEFLVQGIQQPYQPISHGLFGCGHNYELHAQAVVKHDFAWHMVCFDDTHYALRQMLLHRMALGQRQDCL